MSKVGQKSWPRKPPAGIPGLPHDDVVLKAAILNPGILCSIRHRTCRGKKVWHIQIRSESYLRYYKEIMKALNIAFGKISDQVFLAYPSSSTVAHISNSLAHSIRQATNHIVAEIKSASQRHSRCPT